MKEEEAKKEAPIESPGKCTCSCRCGTTQQQLPADEKDNSEENATAAEPDEKPNENPDINEEKEESAKGETKQEACDSEVNDPFKKRREFYTSKDPCWQRTTHEIGPEMGLSGIAPNSTYRQFYQSPTKAATSNKKA